ncbi:MAG: DNA/RNA non-specific endonuclease [Phaeodactylibacter sp.]|nr:DNA/RNA non-specific endonuclease [Phaeodactylibacter sp.]MCB9288423.1 DNA/RNA non-specific endonuclease [Lewinellaceae bacterium]
MAKFRVNHERKGKGSSGSMVVKVGLFSAIIGGLFILFNKFTGTTATIPGENGDEENIENLHYLPASTTGMLIRHHYYDLSYSEEHEQAEWVAYRLTREELKKPWVERVDNFRPDPQIESGSATPDDYRNSGYNRGHLVPAADRAFSEEAIDETFLMSNISPQAANFNKGIWRELEELTRSWAKKNGELFVITGPILTQEPKGKIGENGVSVPAAYFKVLLDAEEPQVKGIGFVIPNEVSFEPLYRFARPIDEVEKLSGLDFFGELLPADIEKEVESEFNIDLWEFSKAKFEERIEKWNNQ